MIKKHFLLEFQILMFSHLNILLSKAWPMTITFRKLLMVLGIASIFKGLQYTGSWKAVLTVPLWSINANRVRNIALYVTWDLPWNVWGVRRTLYFLLIIWPVNANLLATSFLTFVKISMSWAYKIVFLPNVLLMGRSYVTYVTFLKSLSFKMRFVCVWTDTMIGITTGYV